MPTASAPHVAYCDTYRCSPEAALNRQSETSQSPFRSRHGNGSQIAPRLGSGTAAAGPGDQAGVPRGAPRTWCCRAVCSRAVAKLWVLSPNELLPLTGVTGPAGGRLAEAATVREVGSQPYLEGRDHISSIFFFRRSYFSFYVYVTEVLRSIHF